MPETEEGIRERLRTQRTMKCGKCGHRYVQQLPWRPGRSRLVDVLLPVKSALLGWTVECGNCRQQRFRGFFNVGSH